MKNVIKVTTIIMAIWIIFTIPVFAGDPPGASVMSGVHRGNSDAQVIENAGNQILGMILIVGSFVAVGALMLIGIKYITTSPEGKASLKEQIIPYVIGAVLTFGAVGIMSTIYTMAKQNI